MVARIESLLIALIFALLAAGVTLIIAGAHRQVGGARESRSGRVMTGPPGARSVVV